MKTVARELAKCNLDLVGEMRKDEWQWLLRHKGQGHTKETGNHIATAISENCYEPELNTLLNGAAHIEETATQLSERLRNSTYRQRSMPVFSQLRCRVVS
jgi:hypothetical protein